MKNILLATTALVMTAGFASAEVTFSGKAEVGIYDKATAAKAVLYSGIDLDFKMSTTTDGGWTLSTNGDIGGGQIADFRDDFNLDSQETLVDSDQATESVTNTKSVTSVGTPTIKISGNGIAIALKSKGVSSLYDADGDDHDFSIGTTLNGFAVAATGNVSRSTTADSQSSYSLAYTMNALTLSAVGDDNKSNAYTASYVYSDDITVYTTSDTTAGASAVITTGVTLAVAGATVDLSGDQNSHWDASVSYVSGPVDLLYKTDEAAAWNATVNYDLGGGATLFAGADVAKTTMAGINFKF